MATGIGGADHVRLTSVTPAHKATSAIPRRCPNLIREFIRLETLELPSSVSLRPTANNRHSPNNTNLKK